MSVPQVSVPNVGSPSTMIRRGGKVGAIADDRNRFGLPKSPLERFGIQLLPELSDALARGDVTAIRDEPPSVLGCPTLIQPEDGKSACRFVRADCLEQLKQRLDNCKTFRKLTARWVKLSIQAGTVEFFSKPDAAHPKTPPGKS